MASERTQAAHEFLARQASIYRMRAASLKAQVDAGDSSLKRSYVEADGLAIIAKKGADLFVAEASSLPEMWFAGYALRHVVTIETLDASASEGDTREGHIGVAREGIEIVQRFSGRQAAKLEARLDALGPTSMAS